MKTFDWIENTTPEAEGIPSSAVLRFLDAVEEEGLQLHSLHIIRNGKLAAAGVAAPFTEDSIHRIYSAAKGIVSAAVLFAISEGYFDFDTKVVPLLKAHMPENLDPRFEALTVYHLLTMTTGHNAETFSKMQHSDDWVRTFFELPPVYEPGTVFFYDIGAQYILNFLILQETGLNVEEYLKPRLLDPLGIELKALHGAQEIFNSSTIHLRPADMAKLALFYLNEGSWNGRQLLDKKLAKEAGRFHVSNYDPKRGFTNSTAGYALHMWRNAVGGFRLDGGQGQFGLVYPEAGMAVGMMSCEQNMHRILELFQEHVYLACRLRPLPDDRCAQKTLEDRLENWTLAPETFRFYSSDERKLDGTVWKFSSNKPGIDTVSFRFGKETTVSVTFEDGSMRSAVCGREGKWLPGRGFLFARQEELEIGDLGRILFRDKAESLSSAGWRADGSFEIQFRSPSMLNYVSANFFFTGDEARLTLSPEFAAEPGSAALPGIFPAPPKPVVIPGRKC
ncbi:MAG: beta-lactamase family protein [Eubacterium sp.]|nr:beta-lactamase family protein [Eubacterium sp.]